MGSELQPSTGWSWQKDRWLAPVAVPLGFTAWVPALYVGVRTRKPVWIGLGVLCLALLVAGCAWPEAADGDDSTSGFLIIAAWIGGAVSGLLARPSYDRHRFGHEERALAAARGRIALREQARRLAAREPALARELGVGRPDLPGADDRGVVDPNAVPAATLAGVPGLDADVAERIVAIRGRVGRFSSAEDLATLCDLAPDVLDAVRSHLVFLGP